MVAANSEVIHANSEAIVAKRARHDDMISELDVLKARRVQLEQELEQHKVNRTDAGAVILEATGQRGQKETMEKELADLTAKEEAPKVSFEEGSQRSPR